MAFPTTGLIDNFDRADATTLGANWTTFITVFTGARSHDIVTNECKAVDVGAQQDYYNVATYGPDCEAYITVRAVASANEGFGLFLRLVNIGSGATDGYLLKAIKQTGTDTWEIYRIDNAATTLLGATVTGPEFAVGDQIGFEAIGSTLKGYHKPAAGSWTEVLARTDATYSAAGRIGIQSDDQPAVLDDFSGGTVVSSSSAQNMLLLGVG